MTQSETYYKTGAPVEKALRVMNEVLETEPQYRDQKPYVEDLLKAYYSRKGSRARTPDYKTMTFACIYVDYYQRIGPATLLEFSKKNGLDKKEFKSYVRKLCSRLGIYLKPYDISFYVDVIADRLNLSPEVSDMAKNICNRYLEVKGGSGKIPMGIACGALYVSSHYLGGYLTQECLSVESEVSSVTIRNYTNSMEEIIHNDNRKSA